MMMGIMKDLKVKCPRCGKQVGWSGNAYRPFCSEECRLVDLGRWADEDYSIPGGQAPEQDSDDQMS